MTRTLARMPARCRLLSTGLCALLLAACGPSHVGDPWAGGDPQWKRSHFESPTPDEDLRTRAALTQRDR